MKIFTSSELQKEIKNFIQQSKNHKIDIALHDHIKRIIKNSDLSELNHQELEIVNIIEKEKTFELFNFIDKIESINEINEKEKNFFKKIYLHYSYNYGLDIDIFELKERLESSSCNDLGIEINIENLFYKDYLNLEFIIFLKEVFGVVPALKQEEFVGLSSVFNIIDEKKFIKMKGTYSNTNVIQPQYSFDEFFKKDMDRKDLNKYMNFLMKYNKKSFEKENILNYLDDLDDFYDSLYDDEEFYNFGHNIKYLREVLNNLISDINKKINLANDESVNFYNEYRNEISTKRKRLMRSPSKKILTFYNK